MTDRPRPRILRPVTTKGRSVWVSGVPLGSTVAISEDSDIIGLADAEDPVVEVPVSPVQNQVRAVVFLGQRRLSSEEVWPLRDPGEPGPYPDSTMRDVDYGEFLVPTHSVPEGQDGGYMAPLRGRIHLPANSDGGIPDQAHDIPLVMIAHGMWEDPFVDQNSHLGYDWLGKHLARWGMAACSVDLSQANRATAGDGLQQSARGEIILAMLEAVLGDNDLRPLVGGTAVGLVGHSMGGEGVVVAQQFDHRRDLTRIRGVVSLAPTNYRTDIAATGTAYQLVHGSADYLLSGLSRVIGQNTSFNGFRLFDRAWRPRSLAWIDGARHQPWNTVWFDDMLFPDPGPAANHVLDPDHQRSIGQALITALFADVLLGRSEYHGYLSGPATPKAFGEAVVHRQHQAATVEVVDDFGDPNNQHLMNAEEQRDKTVNRRGEAVRAAGGRLDHWADVHHNAVPRGVHDTTSTDLAWTSGPVVAAAGPGSILEDAAGWTMRYESGLGRLEVDDTGWLSLRVAQHYREVEGEPDETWNDFGDDIDMIIKLGDGRHQAGVRLGSIGAVPYPLLWGWEVYTVFVTCRLPIDAFLAIEPVLDLTRLSQVSIHPVSQAPGRVLIDDIEFETTQSTEWSTIAMLRAHELGTGYGPPTDFLDTEIVVQLHERPDETFGLQLRGDTNEAAAQQMLAQLRSAVTSGGPVKLGFRWRGPTVRALVRVTTRP